MLKFVISVVFAYGIAFSVARADYQPIQARIIGYGNPSISTGSPGQEYQDRSTGNIWRRTSTSWDNETSPAVASVIPLPDLMNGGFFMSINYPGMDSWFNGTGHTAGYNYLLPVQSDFAYFRSRNIQVVRLQFRWEHLFPNGVTGSMDPVYLGLMKQTCGWMAALSMGCILDMHNYAIYSAANNGGPQVGASGAPTYAQIAANWATLAAVAKSWPGVIGFDTMNEPISVPNVQAMQQAIVTAIRGTGATQPIAIEGNGFSSAGQWTNANNNPLFSVIDSLNKLIIEVHDYPDCDHSGTHSSWALQSTNPSTDPTGDSCGSTPVTLTTGQTSTQSFLTIAANNGHPRVWLGEVGAATDQPWRTAVDNMVGAVKTYGGFVSLWSAGVGYESQSGYDAGPQPIGEEPDNIIDKPQIGNITKYSGFTAIPYGIVGPSIGTPATASSNFSIVVHGWLPQAVTFTPSDGGAGGTFVPATVTIPAGFSGNSPSSDLGYTFSYTAPASATTLYNISTTNNGGLVDPSPLVYSTYSDPIYSTVNTVGGTIVSAYSTWAPIRSTQSPIVNLRRGSDGAVQSFTALPSTGDLDPVAIANWTGSSTLYLASQPDIAPNKYDTFTQAAASSHYAAPSFADQPVFSLTAINGQPGITYSSNRMSGPADISGQTHACVLTVLKSSGGGLVAIQSPDNSTVWEIPSGSNWFGIRLSSSDTETVMGTLDTTAPHVIDTCYDAGALRLFVDGTKSTATLSETVLPVHSANSPFGLGNTIDGGFFNNYPIFNPGIVGDVLVTTGTYTDAQRRAIEGVYGAHYGITIASP